MSHCVGRLCRLVASGVRSFAYISHLKDVSGTKPISFCPSYDAGRIKIVSDRIGDDDWQNQQIVF
ncbi:MAG: hypothetical protein IGS49_24760 [Chlorogloeopsis fritschii C42_A2020_084]|uniref:hypothetical protein n=1 Tax=Chlorogloeopsis fritschii TaxID=1124 RepID=UPI0019E4E8B4|nr:hypothetical protein [Chlorogloeopsis fritschii]MBF2008566.1 hypothetical protein [Chlorogloeopsis fritschii C42_A2020_084]